MLKTQHLNPVPVRPGTVLIGLLVLVLAAAALLLWSQNSAAHLVSTASVQVGMQNSQRKTGEAASASLVLTFKNQGGRCRADLSRIGNIPSLTNLFDKPCGDLKGVDIANWLENALGESQKWIAREIKNTPRLLRHIFETLRKVK